MCVLKKPNKSWMSTNFKAEKNLKNDSSQYCNAEQVQCPALLSWNANAHISKTFYSNISESQTYSKYYHCQANIQILSLSYIPNASVQTYKPM